MEFLLLNFELSGHPTHDCAFQSSTTPVTPASGSKSGDKKDKPKTQIGAGWKGVAAANACDNGQESMWPEDQDDCYGYGYPYIR